MADVARVSERSRFKRMRGGPSAREHALKLSHADPFSEPLTAFSPMPDIDGALDADWTIDTSFPEVNCDWMREELWDTVRGDRWHYPDPIHIKEARSAVWALRRAASIPSGGAERCLILGDNMGVVLAFARRRAHVFGLLCEVRYRPGFCMARNIRAYIRWAPSELNPADRPSRCEWYEPALLPRIDQPDRARDPCDSSLAPRPAEGARVGNPPRMATALGQVRQASTSSSTCRTLVRGRTPAARSGTPPSATLPRAACSSYDRCETNARTLPRRGSGPRRDSRPPPTNLELASAGSFTAPEPVEDDAEDTSDAEEAPTSSSRTRTLSRARRPSKTSSALDDAGARHGVSTLEITSVTPASRLRYEIEILAFLEFADAGCPSFNHVQDSTVDDALVKYMNKCYKNGE